MAREYLRIVREQLVDIGKENKEMPPGDTKALRVFIAHKIHNVVMAAEAALDKNESSKVTKYQNEIEDLFRSMP